MSGDGATFGSEAVTEGIRVRVHTQYVPEQSSPMARRYVFAYQIEIANVGEVPAQLRTRHWIITDGTGHVEEVKGPGVVGHQPNLSPGEAFTYTSGCVLKTAHGSMEGSYQMVRPDGAEFDAQVAAFTLRLPYSLN